MGDVVDLSPRLGTAVSAAAEADAFRDGIAAALDELAAGLAVDAADVAEWAARMWEAPIDINQTFDAPDVPEAAARRIAEQAIRATSDAARLACVTVFVSYHLERATSRCPSSR
jgi:hypothetical protein